MFKLSYKWEFFMSNLTSSLSEHHSENILSDVTLVSDDEIPFQAHKFVLSAFSPVLKDILLNNPHPNPLIFLRGIKQEELSSILQFIYMGETTVNKRDGDRIARAAEDLQIKILEDKIKKEYSSQPTEDHEHHVKKEEQIEAENLEICDYIPGNEQESAKQSFICKECDASYKSKRGLLYHKNTQHEGFMYSCQKCEYKATTQSRLRKHQESIHEGLYYACDRCDKNFTQLANLQIHIKSIHEGVRYSCNKCDTQFSQQANLTTHKKSVHEGVKYSCNQCDYQASQHSSLKTHKNSVHERIKYSCNECNYQAGWKHQLKAHKHTVHEAVRYPCNQCAYKTGYKQELKKHKYRKHSLQIKRNNDDPV